MEGITITVDNSSYTDERNEFAEVEADEVLMLELSFENNTGESYQPSTMGMEVLVDGSPAEAYPVGDVVLEEAADGESSSGTLAFAITGDPSDIEFVFSPDSIEDSAVFDITPE